MHILMGFAMIVAVAAVSLAGAVGHQRRRQERMRRDLRRHVDRCYS
jgi:hypothetical protein